MSVLKIVIVSSFISFLFSFNLYIPSSYDLNFSLKGIKLKRYHSFKKIDFSNSLVLLSYKDIPLIFEKNLTIITPIGELKEFILTHKKSLSDIKTVINLDFPSKILLDSVNKHYKSIKGSLKDFLANRADAIVLDKRIEENTFDFPLDLYGIDFNKYFIVTSKNFLKSNYFLVNKLNREFEKKFPFRKDLVYKTLLISALYLNKSVNFSDILFENYKLREENEEEELIVDVTSNWPPFDMVENGRLYGIGVDFWRLIAKKANLKYRFNKKDYWEDVLKDIKEKKADLTINTSATPEREKYAIFSKPYISFPLAIICRNNEKFNSINDINSIAVGKNFTAEKLMKKHYPNLNYVETKTVFDALNLVKEKKVDCAVDILPTILWTINKNHLMNLQIAFKTPFKFNVQIMVRKDKPDLLNKINKAIDSITPEEREKIVNRYLNTIIIERKENKVLFLILCLVVCISIFFFFKFKRNLAVVEREAFYDELTKILNRRGVLEKLKNVNSGAILFFDIDHFKMINDTYGHEFGDYVLSEIGKILKETFRKSDIIGRWGGEEFIVILPETRYEDALKLAEKLRRIIESYDFNGKKVTISIGVSEYNKDFEKALKKADEALYEAKRSGRNQVKGKR